MVVDLFQYESGDPNEWHVVIQSYRTGETYVKIYVITDYLCRTCGEYFMVDKYKDKKGTTRGFCTTRCGRKWPGTVPWKPERKARTRILKLVG